MSIENPSKSNNPSKKRYSAQDKRAYCELWRKSTLTKIEFCKLNGISKSSLYRWMQDIAFKEPSTFSQVVIHNEDNSQNVSNTAIEIVLPNEVRLKMCIEFQHLRAIIREVSHASAIIR